MAFGDYTELQASIVDWLKDPALAAQTPVFIALVESGLNRELRVPDMEMFATLTSAVGTIDLPGDFLQAKSLWSGTGAPLKLMTIEDMQNRYGAAPAGPAEAYAIVGPTVYLAPAPDISTDYRLSYWQKIPTLSADSPTNWLLAQQPDIYFYGSLLMAEARGWNDERLPVFADAYSNAVAALKVAGLKSRYGAGPLVPRPPVGDIRASSPGYRRGGYADSALLSDSGDYLVDG